MSIQGLYEPNVIFVTPAQSLTDVVRLMREHRIGDVIVVESQESRKPCGIITDRDIALKAFAETATHSGDISVSDLMSEDICTVRETDELFDVVNIMSNEGIVRLPVIDKAGKLCGVITAKHCLRSATEILEKLTHISDNQKDTDEETSNFLHDQDPIDEKRSPLQ